MSVTIYPSPDSTISGTVLTDDKTNETLIEEISKKLSTIIRQNNEAFNQEEPENGDN